MDLSRRDALAGLGGMAAVLAGGLPAQAATISRTFKAYHGSKHLGGQVIRLSRSGSRLVAQLATEFRGRVLFFPIQYKHECTEVWSGGVVQSIKSTTRENDRNDAVTARRVAAGLEVDGSRYQGIVPGNPATSSFFVPDIAKRKTWVSTQSGKPLTVGATPRGRGRFETAEGPVDCQIYSCRGDLKVPVDLYYTDAGELAGYIASARGIKIHMIAQSLSPALSPLWG